MTTLISSTTKRLGGKVALITGGASGIGQSMAKIFAHHGGKIVIADIQQPRGSPSEHHLYVPCDVTDETQVKSAVDSAVSAFGRLDIMVNNAGNGGSPTADILLSELSEFRRVMAVNVTGVFLGTKHAARVMIPSNSGAIINTASVSAGVSAVNAHAYTCSKSAVVGLTKNAAAELGRFGVRVNCVSPFVVATPMTCQGLRLDEEKVEEMARSVGTLKGATLKAEDVANATLFLASEEARYVSGVNLVVDGGFSNVNSALSIYK